MTLTIRLKINIKRYNDVITTSNDRLKIFKNARRKFFKHRKKNETQSVNEKSKREKKIEKTKIIICYTCQEKKHYASNCFQFSKNTRMKIDVNVVETTKKENVLKQDSKIFKNSRRIKNESNFVYEITIKDDDEKII